MPNRSHPHRLAAEAYREPGLAVAITLSARGGLVLSHDAPARVLVESLGEIGHRRGIRIHAYCIMPEHVHIICSVGDDGDLAKWVRYLKRESARLLGVPGLWQRSYWDRTLWNWDQITLAAEYLMANPIRRGLVRSWQEWPYSWSRWVLGCRGQDPNVYEDRACPVPPQSTENQRS